MFIAAEHNKRERKEGHGAANIDATRTHLNYSLMRSQTAHEIALSAKIAMLKAGIDTPRKNQVMAVEVIFSLPIDRHQQDTKPFFVDCFEWVMKDFAGELLSFDVHLDEAAPHAHAIILPLIDGKMQGSDLIGGKGTLIGRIDRFHKEVALHHGLSKSERKRLSNTDKATLERLVLSRLKTDAVMQSSVWPIVRDVIHKDPLLFAQSLSVQLKPAKQGREKSFVDHKRSKGKGSFAI